MSTSEYRIASEPRSTAYEALIRYCQAEGETCSLVDLFATTKAGRAARSAFLERAEPHLLATEQVHCWPLGSEHGGGIIGKAVPLWVFKLNPQMADLLVERPRGLFGWTASANLPEDLAVYRKDGSVLLGTVAHEHVGWMLLTRDDAEDRRLGLVELEPRR